MWPTIGTVGNMRCGALETELLCGWVPDLKLMICVNTVVVAGVVV
jgi:hypothetical protein